MTKITGASVNAAGYITGASVDAVRHIAGRIASGSMIINDWQITMEDVEGGHILTAKRGSEVQTMFIRDGSGEGGGGTSFITDETLSLVNGVLSVNTADTPEEDNTLPITSAAVHSTVGNIETLLGTI